MLCYLGELNSSAEARWLTTVEVFNQQGEAQQLKLFPSHVAPPPDDPQVTRVLLHKVRLKERGSSGRAFASRRDSKRQDRQLSPLSADLLELQPARFIGNSWSL